MSMSGYRFARELGNPLARGLKIYKTTRLWHSLASSDDAGVLFRGRCHHTHGVSTLDIEKKDGRYMVSGGADGGICLWDLDQLPPTCTPPPSPLEPRAAVPGGPQSHQFGVSSVAYYPPDPGLFVTASYDKSVKVWDANELTVAFTFDLGLAPHSVAIAPHARHALVAVSSASPAIRLLDLASGSATHSLVHGGRPVGTCTANWSPRDEHILASGGSDGTVMLWDIRMAAGCIACLDMTANSGRHRLDGRNRAHEGPVNGLTWNETGSSLITLGHDGKLRVWDLATGEHSPTSSDTAAVRNRSQHSLNPVLTTLRQSNPQLVFVPSGTEVVGLRIPGGSAVLRLAATQHKINALVCRPHLAELYYGSSGGEINRLAPQPATENVGHADDGEDSASKADELDAIYRSLVQKPITLTR